METPFKVGEQVQLDITYARKMDVRDEIVDALRGQTLVVQGWDFPFVIVCNKAGDTVFCMPDILYSVEEPKEEPFKVGQLVSYKEGHQFADGNLEARIIDITSDQIWLNTGTFVPKDMAEKLLQVNPVPMSKSIPEDLLNIAGFKFPKEDPQPATAKDVIHEVAETLVSRGKSRDNGQERSMARTVRTFNAMTDHELTEEDGWLFMQYLKDSRSRSGDYNFDDYLDKAGYAVLAAECADKTHHDSKEKN